jgi:hypothetical protein
MYYISSGEIGIQRLAADLSGPMVDRRVMIHEIRGFFDDPDGEFVEQREASGHRRLGFASEQAVAGQVEFFLELGILEAEYRNLRF